MKLFLISQEQNSGYDTFDSAVVAAPDEDTASKINPGSSMHGQPGHMHTPILMDWSAFIDDWCDREDQVVVKYLGKAAPGITLGCICASFNAG